MAWPVEEGDCATQEGDDCYRLLVGQDFGVGEAAVVVDGDVHVLPTELAAAAAAAAVVLACPIAGHAVTGACDPPKLLDVDVDQLTRP
jgi:hypothetical protein